MGHDVPKGHTKYSSTITNKILWNHIIYLNQQARSINVDPILAANVFANINPSDQTGTHCGINQNVKLAQIV